jgi:hypothetical protein
MAGLPEEKKPQQERAYAKSVALSLQHGAIGERRPRLTTTSSNR